MTTTAAAKPRHRVYAYETDKAAPAVAPDNGRMEAFTFGDPEPVTSMRDVWYEGVWLTPDEWYEPPIPLSVLAKTYRATPHHGSAMQVKRNILLKTFLSLIHI